MSSDRGPRAEEILDRVMTELQGPVIRSRIDAPVDTVLEDFLLGADTGAGGERPGDLLAEFVQRVYTVGFRAGWAVGDARAATISLLETYYRGLRADGYFAAVQDLTNSEVGGLPFVLTQVAEIIKASERHKHIEGVFLHYLDPSKPSAKHTNLC